MPYSISLAENDTILVVKISSPSDTCTAFDYANEIHDYMVKMGIKKLLVDCTECELVSTITGIYKLAYDDLNKLSDFQYKARTALLVSSDDHSRDFMETVFINTGHILRLFRNREQAMEYLKGSPDTRIDNK